MRDKKIRLTACAGSTGTTFGLDRLGRESAIAIDIDQLTDVRNVENVDSMSDHPVTYRCGPMRVPPQRGNVCSPDNA